MWSPFLKTFLGKIKKLRFFFFQMSNFEALSGLAPAKQIFFYGFKANVVPHYQSFHQKKKLSDWTNTDFYIQISVTTCQFWGRISTVHRSSRGTLYADILDPTGGNWRWISLFMIIVKKYQFSGSIWLANNINIF